MIKIITIEREYGSGGGEIAQLLAQQLGWKLWDQLLTEEIARLAECPKAIVERREERRRRRARDVPLIYGRSCRDGAHMRSRRAAGARHDNRRDQGTDSPYPATAIPAVTLYGRRSAQLSMSNPQLMTPDTTLERAVSPIKEKTTYSRERAGTERLGGRRRLIV